jgi:hypothetical protein
MNYENTPTVQYEGHEGEPIYYRVCPICGKYVKADDKSTIPQYLVSNATCKIHGRVAMPFACWASDLEGED